MNKSHPFSIVMILALVGGFFMQSCTNTQRLDDLMESHTIHDTIYTETTVDSLVQVLVDAPVEAPTLIYGYVVKFQGIQTVYGFNNKLECWGGNNIFGNYTYQATGNYAILTMKWAWGEVTANYILTFTSSTSGTYIGTLENVNNGEDYGVWNTNFTDGPVSGTFTYYHP